ELMCGVPTPSGDATTLIVSVGEIHTQPGPAIGSDFVAPLSPSMVPKSIRVPGVGSPTFGRICSGTSTSCGDNVVPGAICSPLGPVAGAVVMTSDIRRTACPGL